MRTARHSLRELTLDDLPFVARLLGDAQAMLYFGGPFDVEQSRGWIERQLERYARDGFGYWLIVDSASGAPVGQAGVMLAEVDGQPEPALGYIVEPHRWRRGIAFECARACRDHAFRSLDCPRVISLIRPENLPSLAMAVKLGMRIERRTIYARYEHFVLSQHRPPVGG